MVSGENQTQDTKKAYEPPTLTIHGKVDELTQATGSRGQLDGGSTLGHRRTHFI
jgi:hypothetical protein